MKIVQRWDRRFYPAFSENWDDEIFRCDILDAVQPHHTVLDLGAGAGVVKQMNFRGVARKICGIDPSERVLANPHLNEARIGRGEYIPYDAASFDVVFSDNVLEHLPDPLAVFKEVARVLKPGGVFLAKTPNRFHYVAMIASLTPMWFHRFCTGLMGGKPEDAFPTTYRANTAATISRLANRAGFTDCRTRLVEGRPEYLRVSPLTYPVGIAYERAVNSTDALACLRVVIFTRMVKA